MLKIYICEDEYYQQRYLEKIIKKTICIENYDMQISLMTNDPYEVLNNIKDTNETGMYFLDVHLKSDINGIQLAEKIRHYDPRCFIVFITADKSMSYLTFLHKVEAMDYILKDDFTNLPFRIKDCLHNAYTKYSSKNNKLKKIFSAKVDDSILNVNYDDILFFETSPTIHKVLLHYNNEVVEFYGKMKELEKILDDRFCRCHTSFIINKDKIREINKKERIAYLVNNKECLISTRGIKLLIK